MAEFVDPRPAGIDKQTLSDYAYDELSRALLSGHLKPGEKLTLRHLMAKFNTSSTPIRDAIQQLSVENAIDFVPNRYIRVPVLGAYQLRELRDIRIALEGLAAFSAAQHMTGDKIVALKGIDSEIRTARDSGNLQAAMAAIFHFHFLIYRAAERDHLLSLIRGLWLRTGPYRSVLFPNYSQMERGNLRILIINALERGDSQSARTFMEADITGSMNFIIGQAEAIE
jgi:DNA-binding GntR family transcriptional regulator